MYYWKGGMVHEKLKHGKMAIGYSKPKLYIIWLLCLEL